MIVSFRNGFAVNEILADRRSLHRCGNDARSVGKCYAGYKVEDGIFSYVLFDGSRYVEFTQKFPDYQITFFG